MKDIIYTVLAIAAIFIGLPVLILWLRDRGGLPGAIIKKALGGVALAFGLIIIGWVVFNGFHPTKAFRSSLKTPFQLLLPVAMIWIGWRWLRDEGPGIEETPADFDCEELRLSVIRAREALPRFLEQVKQNVDEAYVKFPLKTPNGLTEHIWAYVHSCHDDQFNVSLSNEPVDKGQSSSGRRDVPFSDVEDWQIMLPDGRIKGAYSLIALFQHHESKGKRLSRKMRKQRAQLIDAEPK
jgi:uncharacterized protein YegJ (DUF2314 family)